MALAKKASLIATMELSPIHLLTMFCVLAWIVFFTVHRLLMFGQFHMEEIKLWENDFFVATNICNNETLKANLGMQYQNICEEAEVNVNVWPTLRAVRKVIQHTYLCGDSSCVHIFEDVLSVLSGTLVWTLSAVVVTLSFVVVALIACSSRRARSPGKQHRTLYDIESTRVQMKDKSSSIFFIADESELEFSEWTHPTDKSATPLHKKTN